MSSCQGVLTAATAWQKLLPEPDTALWRGSVTGAAPYSIQIQSSKSQILVMPRVLTAAKLGDYLSTVQLNGAAPHLVILTGEVSQTKLAPVF